MPRQFNDQDAEIEKKRLAEGGVLSDLDRTLSPAYYALVESRSVPTQIANQKETVSELLKRMQEKRPLTMGGYDKNRDIVNQQRGFRALEQIRNLQNVGPGQSIAGMQAAQAMEQNRMAAAGAGGLGAFRAASGAAGGIAGDAAQSRLKNYLATQGALGAGAAGMGQQAISNFTTQRDMASKELAGNDLDKQFYAQRLRELYGAGADAALGKVALYNQLRLGNQNRGWDAVKSSAGAAGTVIAAL